MSTTILDYKGDDVESKVGPYELDAVVTLTCLSYGGDPIPKVTWWRNNRVIDESYERIDNDTVQNSLILGPLTRDDLGAELICISSNSPGRLSVSSKVIMDMVLPPLHVRIISKLPLKEGIQATLVCEVIGSKPQPIVTWWLMEGQLEEKWSEVTSLEVVPRRSQSVVRSTLVFTPSRKDHGRRLKCKAETPGVPNSGREESWTLAVNCMKFLSRNIFIIISCFRSTTTNTEVWTNYDWRSIGRG